jgi:fatty acid desaturase
MHFSMPSMRRSRHPLVRALSLLVGVALIGVLLVFGLMVAGVLLVGGALLLAWRQWKHGRVLARQPAATRTTHQPDVLEGEYVVIQQGRPVAH